MNGDTRETEEEMQEQGKGSTKSILQLGKEKELAAAAVQTKTRHSRKPLPRLKGPLRRSKETTKEDRHPFALYGWGEKQADMASKKTHNVCPAASTGEVTDCSAKKRCNVCLARAFNTTRHISSIL